jgi:aspartate aminotransferase-like enzyme
MVELAASARNRGVYFDIVEMERFARTNQVPATPAFSLLYALEVQLASMQREGIEHRWDRHQEMVDATTAWLIESSRQAGIHWANIVAEPHRSPTVSTIRLPENIRGREFVARVKSHGIQVASGYGKLADTTFRIGHMGDHTVSTLERCFEACEKAISS